LEGGEAGQDEVPTGFVALAGFFAVGASFPAGVGQFDLVPPSTGEKRTVTRVAWLASVPGCQVKLTVDGGSQTDTVPQVESGPSSPCSTILPPTAPSKRTARGGGLADGVGGQWPPG